MGPRNVAGAVVRGPDFWGRESEVRELWRRLERGSVLLTGPRRWGKSSIMSALEDEPFPGWQVIGLDVEAVETPAEFLTELIAAVLARSPSRKLLSTLRNAPGALAKLVKGAFESVEASALPGIGDIKIRLRAGLDDRHWADLGQDLFEHLGAIEGSLLVILDEFPMMLATFLEKGEGDALAFMRWFRAQRQASQHPATRFLLGGSVNIEPRLERLASQAVLNDLERYAVNPMSEADAKLFVREVLATEGVTAPEMADAIFDCIGVGVHFFIQVLISECLSEARSRGVGALGAADVRRVYESRVLGAASRGRFSHYQTRLRTYYGIHEGLARRILWELTTSERTLTALQSMAGDDELDEVLSRLEGDYYISREADRIRFHSAFLRDWWRQNAPGAR